MSGDVPLAGVIGDPIGHSRSPVLHGYWLRALGLRGAYVPLHVRADDLAQVLEALPKAGFRGVNVTVPHKELALSLAAEVTERARRIGAANTLTFLPGGGFEADNTDGVGFMANLRAGAPGWRPEAGPAVLLGAGGAARAVLDALLDAGVPEVRLANRTRARAEALAEVFGPRVTVRALDAPGLCAGAATVVNATTLGMDGAGGFSLPLDGLEAGALATDLIYAPLDTPFLQAARARGCATVDGLGMLLHQGAPGFARWFGAMPEVTEALREAVLAA